MRALARDVPDRWPPRMWLVPPRCALCWPRSAHRPGAGSSRRRRSAEVRSAPAGRPRHRCEEQHQRGPRCRHQGWQDRGRRRPHRSGRRVEGGQRRRPYVTPGLVDIHAHVYAGTGERGSYAGDLSVYPGRLHVPGRRDHRGGCRLRRLAQFRGLQGPHHRSLQDARAGVPQHRGQRNARRQVRAAI